MSGRRKLTAAAAASLSVLLLVGCTYDYGQHSDRISYRAGDAVNANLEGETIDPSSASMYDTTGLGKNGSVQPPSSSTSPSTPTNPPAPTNPPTAPSTP